MPPYPGDTATPLPDFSALYRDIAPAARRAARAFPRPEEAIGSNNWVVAGARSETGKPLLANDPHLGLQAPALWYLAHVATPAGNVVGGTLPGLPFVVLGRNDHVAWSMTTTGGDTQDLFIERVAPDDPTSLPHADRHGEVRAARGGDPRGPEERRIVVRSTRHGPVISDVVASARRIAPRGHVIALAWARAFRGQRLGARGLRPQRARAMPRQFVDAARDFHAPQQNVVFADSRRAASASSRPRGCRCAAPTTTRWAACRCRAGSRSTTGRGSSPSRTCPPSMDPPGGQHRHRQPQGHAARAIGPSSRWTGIPPYRAERIEELLAGAAEALARLVRAACRRDNRSRLARELLPAARAAGPADRGGPRGAGAAAGWEGGMADRFGRAAGVRRRGIASSRAWCMPTSSASSLRDGVGHARAVHVRGDARARAAWSAGATTRRRPRAESCATQAARAFDLAADRPARAVRRARRMALGCGAPCGERPPPVRLLPGGEALVQRDARRRPATAYTVNVGALHHARRGAPVRQSPRGKPARALRPRRPRPFAASCSRPGSRATCSRRGIRNLAERWARVEYLAIPTRREAIVAAHTLVLKP